MEQCGECEGSGEVACPMHYDCPDCVASERRAVAAATSELKSQLAVQKALVRFWVKKDERRFASDMAGGLAAPKKPDLQQGDFEAAGGKCLAAFAGRRL